MTKEDIKIISKIVNESNKDSENRMEKKMRVLIAESIDDLTIPTIKSSIKDSEEKMEKSMDVKLEKQKKEIVHELQDSNDALAKEVKDFREEQASKSYVLEQLDEKYLDHEKRISILEQKASI